MSEVIKVDFKAGVILSRQEIGKEPVSEWKASKDPNFKEFVSGLAVAAEAFAAAGGDWAKAVIVIRDELPGEDELCFTIWDRNSISDEEVIAALAMAAEKVGMSEKHETS